MPSLLEGDAGPAEALRRSWNLTQRNVWRAMGYVVLAYMLAYIVVGTPVSALQLIAGFALPIESQWLTVALFSAISVVANLLLSPINAIASVLFYYELRVRKESYDLEIYFQ